MTYTCHQYKYLIQRIFIFSIQNSGLCIQKKVSKLKHENLTSVYFIQLMCVFSFHSVSFKWISWKWSNRKNIQINRFFLFQLNAVWISKRKRLLLTSIVLMQTLQEFFFRYIHYDAWYHWIFLEIWINVQIRNVGNSSNATIISLQTSTLID